MNKIKSLMLIGLSLLFIDTIQAKVTLPSLIGSGAVLQRNSQVLLWGRATPSSRVVVSPSWSGEHYTTQSDSSGAWSLEVTTADAGEGYSITLSDGDGSTTIDNILLGEVWLCAGQSNMEMPMRGFNCQPVEGSANVIMTANPSRPIRYYKVERAMAKSPSSHTTGEWELHTPQTVDHFSATAYFFADYIEQVLGVPVGIIDCTWGGTPIEAWMSPEALGQVGQYDLSHLSSDETMEGNYRKASYLYNGMMHPLFGYKIKGMLWYQGESNRHRPEEYSQLFPAFAASLRQGFDSGTFPIYFAEIAPFGYTDTGRKALRLREVMGQAADAVERCEMISLLDVGEPNMIHASKKRVVGERFAYLALGDCYGVEGIDYLTPRYKEIAILPAEKRLPSRIAIRFSNANKGICFLPEKGSSDLIEVAGEDRVFYPAQVRFLKSGKYQLEAWSEQVAEPVAVRYGYKIFVKGDLFNLYGLPVPSFRSDHWPVDWSKIEE